MSASRAIALTAVLLGTGCGGPAATTPGAATPAPTAAPSGAAVGVEADAGAYRTASGVTYAVNGHGDVVRLSDGWIRQVSPTATPGVFTVGPGYLVATPVEAQVDFHRTDAAADRLTITPQGGAAEVATRLPLRQTEVRVQARDAVLAATVTEPPPPGPHPGIVIVHGSGPGPRIDYGVWVALYASLGMTVLSYDKRGNGDSTGRYPGDLASDHTLAVLADDAAACLRFLSAWPGVDAHRVGFHGGSQGGWIVPLAVRRAPAAAFAVLVSGPAVTVDQQGVWADFSGNSHHLPTASPAEMDAAMRAAHTGYDPGPVLAATTAPIVWINGALDRQVPTALNTEVLRGLHRPNFDVQVLPGLGHSLLEDGTGLVQDDVGARRLGRDLFPRIAAWLAKHVGSSPHL